jgi:haloalkane dehalogenase
MTLPGVDPTLYPFAAHHHTLASGHRLHYVDEGPDQGAAFVSPTAPPTTPTLVMVHGNPSWSFYYRDVIQHFRASRRCLALDHIGMGLSDRPPEHDYAYTLSQRMADFAEWLNAVAPDQMVDLMVHDWGGAIALSWAARHPKRVRKLIITNTWAFPLPAGRGLPLGLKFARSGLGRWLIRRANAFSALAATRLGTRKRLPPAVARGLTAPYRGHPERRLATLKFVEDIPLTATDPAYSILKDTEARLPALNDHAMLLAWGMHDWVFTPEVLALWQGHFPSAEVACYDEAGHYLNEDAGPMLIQRIATFLQEPPRSAA